MKYLPEAKTSVKAYPGLYNTYPNYNGVINSNNRLCPLTARSNRTPVFLIWKKYSGGEKKEGGWKQEEKQSPTCHIWDLGTCPAQVTRSRWYPWQVDGWITEHPVNQRPWKRVTQRAPLALSRSRIKMLDDRTAWITSRLKNMERKKEAFSNLSTDAHRTKPASVLFFISPSPLSLSLSLSLPLCFWKIVFQEGWQSARKSGCFTLNYLRTQLPVCSSFWSFDRRAAWTRSFWQRGIGGSGSNSEVEIIRVSLGGQRVL